MTDPTRQDLPRHDVLLSRRSDSDSYRLWQIDATGETLLQPIPLDPGAQFPRDHQIIAIGRYLLEWGPLTLPDYNPCYPFRLFTFDPADRDPLAGKTVSTGVWTKKKFWGYRADFGNPDGPLKEFSSGALLQLLPMHNFVLNLIPTAGRGTFQLWNFDPRYAAHGVPDPLPAPYTPMGAFDGISAGDELLPIGNYVLHRVPASGNYRVLSFDPQNLIPLATPAIQQGTWPDIDASHNLVVIGETVLDWIPADRTYRLWGFDPTRPDPLTGPLHRGVLPAGFEANTSLTAIQPLRPIDTARATVPGTVDFMRSKIKHVVHYMVENRSFDHVLGWLYQQGEQDLRVIGREGPFQGASLDMFNRDPLSTAQDKRVFLSQYKDGKLSTEWALECLVDDPYHDKSDALRQLFFANTNGYAQRATPDMGGFVANNGTHLVMTTYTPQQLPILNGLASNFAVSDEWFSSTPGATDVNRAFAFTGSALGQLNNFQNGNQYIYWPDSPHRPSIWKVLWSNGFTDWKLYHSVEWMDFVHTYHLFLQGQIPTVDANVADHIADFEAFTRDAAAGTLPAFSCLEPIWIAMDGTTSYHPGADLVPGERRLNDIYNALRTSPAWDETLLVITFDEHGGIFDHVPPPYAANPWPNDVADSFRNDIMGMRVPCILVSPWVSKHTVFRSATETPYDSTSFLATLLHWYGIPRSRWGLGDRVARAATFQAVFQEPQPRRDAPVLTPPYDNAFPPDGPHQGGQTRLTDLHRLMAPRLVWALTRHRLTPRQSAKAASDILDQTNTLQGLCALIDKLAKQP